jgi:hypothetical protein
LYPELTVNIRHAASINNYGCPARNFLVRVVAIDALRRPWESRGSGCAS